MKPIDHRLNGYPYPDLFFNSCENIFPDVLREPANIVNVFHLNEIHTPAYAAPVGIQLQGWGWLRITATPTADWQYGSRWLHRWRYLSGDSQIVILAPKGAQLTIRYANIFGRSLQSFDVPVVDASLPVLDVPVPPVTQVISPILVGNWPTVASFRFQLRYLRVHLKQLFPRFVLGTKLLRPNVRRWALRTQRQPPLLVQQHRPVIIDIASIQPKRPQSDVESYVANHISRLTREEK